MSDFRLIISAGKSIVFSFLIKDNDVYEVRIEKREEKRLVGSIFKGKVRRISKSLNGAFIDIGLDREAYLLIKNAEEGSGCPKLKEGDSVIVQLKREQIEEKGAKVTCRISLPGKNLVYLPNDRNVFISSKIKDEEKRKELKEFLESIINGEGVIVRTCAEGTSKEDLIKELEVLRNTWKKILEKAKSVDIGIIYEAEPVYLQLIKDHWQEITEIVVDDKEIWNEILTYLEETLPDLISRVRYVKDISTFFKKYQIDRVLTKLFSKYVWLKGGGFIVIEETEAMTVIDVNSGSGSGNNLEENALQTNLEAAEEIARQIKLRNLGGIIVIDFIDMKDKKNRKLLVEKMKELFADEGSNVHIYGLTNLGLLEMTRKKETPSVTKILSMECPYCKGKGFIKSPEVVLYEIEKEIAYYKGKYLEIRVNPLLRKKVEELIEKSNLSERVSIKEECDVPMDYYEIVIMQ